VTVNLDFKVTEMPSTNCAQLTRDLFAIAIFLLLHFFVLNAVAPSARVEKVTFSAISRKTHLKVCHHCKIPYYVVCVLLLNRVSQCG